MITAYFDESLNRNSDLVIVAGWTATVEQWEGFEADWKLFLVSFRKPYLHMREFAHSNGPYVAWKNKESIRRKFLSEAAEIICSRVQAGFIFWMQSAALNTADALFAVKPLYPSPYAYAGRSCMLMARNWQGEEPQVIGMRYVFHDDGPDKGGLMAAMTSITPFLPTPSFEADHDWQPTPQWPDGRKGLVQLQAADFLAYEAKKSIDERIRERKPPSRKSLGALLAAADIQIGNSSAMKLAKFCMERGITKRLPPESEIYDKFKP